MEERAPSGTGSSIPLREPEGLLPAKVCEPSIGGQAAAIYFECTMRQNSTVPPIEKLATQQGFALIEEMDSARNLLAYGERVIRTAAFIETTRDPSFTVQRSATT
jgi:hypothetical protein